jgi:hypothetical protein
MERLDASHSPQFRPEYQRRLALSRRAWDAFAARFAADKERSLLLGSQWLRLAARIA